MTTKAELIAEIKTTNSCECTNCKTQKYRLISLAEQLPDTPNPFAGIELYAPIPAGRKVIGIRAPKNDDHVLYHDGTAGITPGLWSTERVRIILAPPPPPKTWDCPGLKDGVYVATCWRLEYGTYWSLSYDVVLQFNSKLTKPEHLGTYDVVNEVGTLRKEPTP